MTRHARYLSRLLIAAMLLPLPAAANSLGIAQAMPLSGIVVDGDLSDWPETLVYPMRWNPQPYGPTDLRGIELQPSADLSPEFMVGYDPLTQLLYVAVRVRDDEMRTGLGVLATDACEIYLWTEGQTMPAQYILCPAGGSYFSTNPRLQIGGEFRPLEETRTQTAVVRRGDVTVYEWAIDPFLTSPPGSMPLAAGTTFGFDVVAVDRDDDEMFSNWVTWNQTSALRMFSPLALGSLRLVDSQLAFQTLEGIVNSSGQPFADLRLRAEANGMNLGTTTDSLGRFQLRLPEGRWELTPESGQLVSWFSRTIDVPATGSVAIDVTALHAAFLARLVLSVEPDEQEGFASLYEKRLLPALRQAGWIPAAASSRPTADSLFTRLFQWKSTGSIARAGESLWGDGVTDLSLILEELGARFGTQREDGRLEGDLHLYSTPPMDIFTQSIGAPPQYDEPPPGRAVRVGSGIAAVATAERVPAGPGVRNGDWHTFTVRDGMPPSSGKEGDRGRIVDRDPHGHLWFVVDGGLTRFDGRTFSSWTMTDSMWQASIQPRDLVASENNQVWLATEGGLFHFDGKRFISYAGEHPMLGAPMMDLSMDADGGLWLSTQQGLGRLHAGTLTVFGPEDGMWAGPVRSTALDDQGLLWIGSPAGVGFFDGQRFHFQPAGSNGNGERLDTAADGAVWVYSPTGWLRLHSEGLQLFGSADGFPPGYMWMKGPQVDAQGHHWIATPGGLQRIALAKPTTFKSASGLSDYSLNVYADKSGVWAIGTGLSHYEANRLTTFRVEDGLPNKKVISLLEAEDGRILIGGGGGLSVYEDGRLRHLDLHPVLVRSDIEVRDILQDRQGNVWIGTYSVSSPEGAMWWDGEERVRQYTTADGLTSNWIASITQDSAGDLWFATVTGGRGIAPFGVDRFDGEHFESYTFRDTVNSAVWKIRENRPGDLWFATIENGIFRFDGKDFTHLTREDGLASNLIQGPLVKDRQGRMLIGTQDNGVSVFVDGEFVDSITVADGLIHGRVRAILEDRLGHIWVGTRGGGITRFDGDVYQHFDDRDGLAHNLVYDLLEDRHGDIWIATREGLTRYRPNRTAPSITLTRIVAAGVFSQQDKIAVPSTVNQVTFEFEGTSLVVSAEDFVYQYRLLGHDEQWLQTRDKTVMYEDLPIGEFAFEVRAFDRDLNRSDTASVRVEIHLPYTRIMAIGATCLALFVILWQAVRIVRRGHHLAAANRALEATNTELTQQRVDLEQAHLLLQESQAQLVQTEKMATLGLLAGGVAHEINNPLQTILDGANRILRYPEEAARHVQSAELMQKAAKRCSSVVQSLLGYARSGRREGEPVRLNEVLDTTLALLAGQFHSADVELVDERGEDAIAEGDFGDLCTVATNLLVNARDAAASREHDANNPARVRLRTTQEDGRIILEVSDNGAGLPDHLRDRIFDPFFTTKDVGAGSGLGLAIVRTLLERHGGTIRVESLEGQGATFVVSLVMASTTSER